MKKNKPKKYKVIKIATAKQEKEVIMKLVKQCENYGRKRNKKE